MRNEGFTERIESIEKLYARLEIVDEDSRLIILVSGLESALAYYVNSHLPASSSPSIFPGIIRNIYTTILTVTATNNQRSRLQNRTET